MLCTSCGEDSVLEMTEQAQTVCTRCGTVLSENAIVSDIQFGETGSGAAMVQGAYVSHDQSESEQRIWCDKKRLTLHHSHSPHTSSRRVPPARNRLARIARTDPRKW